MLRLAGEEELAVDADAVRDCRRRRRRVRRCRLECAHRRRVRRNGQVGAVRKFIVCEFIGHFGSEGRHRRVEGEQDARTRRGIAADRRLALVPGSARCRRSCRDRSAAGASRARCGERRDRRPARAGRPAGAPPRAAAPRGRSTRSTAAITSRTEWPRPVPRLSAALSPPAAR